MAPKYRRPMLLILILIIVFAIIVFILVNLHFFRRTIEHYKEIFLNEQYLQLQLSSSAIQENINSAVSETSILATYSFVEFEKGLRSEDSIAQLLRIEKSTYNNVLLYAYFREPGSPLFVQTLEGGKGRRAREIARRNVREEWESLASSYRELGTGEPRILPFYPGEEAQLANFAYPVVVDGRFRGVLYMSLDLGRYAESYLKTDGTEQPYDFCICNRSGEIVWSDKKQRLGDRIYEDFPGFPRTELGEDGKALFEDEGERYFAAWSKVHLGEDFFRVCMTTPSEEIFLVPSTITYLRRSINLLLLAIVLIAGLYTYRLYRLYREKYVQLKREVELQEKVREKSRELSSVERHYSVLFNNAHDGIFIMRGDTITDCNNRAAEMFGTGKQDLLGHRPYDLSPETQPDGSSSAELAEQYIGRCRSGTPQLFEWRHRRSDGSLFTAEISLSAIEIEGDVLIQAFIRDVTQRKEMEEHLQHALEEKETLLREVHHRTKNNMQLITSLLNLEHSSIEDPAALAVVTKSIRRIHALSTAHEYLHQSQNLLSINLGDYIKDFISVQLAELKDVEIRPEVSIESEIETSIEGAIPFGLIVNELIHNVRIHAFPEGGGGELQLRIYRESGQLVLIVEDNGLGKDGDIDVSDEGSLGVQLITSLVHQLGGSFEVRQNGGTRWYITFPLAADADNGTVESKLFFVRKS